MFDKSHLQIAFYEDDIYVWTEEEIERFHNIFKLAGEVVKW